MITVTVGLVLLLRWGPTTMMMVVMMAFDVDGNMLLAMTTFLVSACRWVMIAEIRQTIEPAVKVNGIVLIEAKVVEG